ncbi:tyrosine-type recombinase/integrase [Methylobacterium mesophilicum]|uniref:tyrosine-type recombinase/integrase n=1 Tax=Methylobacterium mesophilicum TaxID=39956 RepID=UPI001EE33773|nr:tyrosine-type recombinase/integrase [Methylobacterium mesophilicum]
MALSTYFEQYLERAKTRLKAANQKTLERHLRHDFATLASFPIADIRRAHVAQCLDEITVRAPATANRARSQLSTFFAWAIGQGLTETNPVIGTNKPAKDVRRSRVLSASELATVWRVVGDDDFGRIIRLLILTGQRRNEVARMVWDELDLEAGVWTIPAERAKNGRVHEVPLSEPAVAILRTCSMREGVPYLFGRNRTGPFSGFSAAKDRLDAAVQLRTPWVIHDLRRTLATGMNDLKVPPHIVEAVINHVSGAKGGVAGTYNWALYREEKREALDFWAAHVLKLGQPLLQVVTTDTETTFAEA